MRPSKFVCSLFIITFSLMAKAEGVKIGADGFILNANGLPLKYELNQYEASEQCKQVGLRLPTARELIKEQLDNGAILVEVADFNQGKLSQGVSASKLYLVSAINSDGSRDQFYTNYNDNYQVSSSPVKYLWTWSSSTFAENSDRAFGFDGRAGFLGGGARTNGKYSARCVH